MILTHSHPRLVRFVLAVATTAWCGVTVLGTSGPAGSAARVIGTPLPPGWELCIAQGVGAPVTPPNVADLDAWQAAEGGSTKNTAANNPFNTRRTTDVNGNPLPMTSDVDGFPAYATWLAGCAATVATIEQPNMSSILAALKAGDVSPPGGFLAAVDQSAWCAPSDGQPCYLSDIVGSATTGAVPAVLTSSSALDVYGHVQSDIHDYELALLTTSVDQQTQLAWHEQLDAAQSAVSDAQRSYDAIERKLERFAIAEYVNSGMFENSAFLGGDGAQGPNTAAVQQYTNVTGDNLVARAEAAATVVQNTEAQRGIAFTSLQGSGATLSSDNARVTRILTQLLTDLATMQTAGACTAITITVAAPGSTSTTNTTTTTTTTTPAPPSSPTSTTTTSAPAPPSSPTSTTTTTTTVPASSTTTTSTAPGSSGGNDTSSTTTTSTTSTTTTVPASSTTTTTTTTLPTLSPDGTPVVNPAGLESLQLCVASLAPNRSA